MSPVTNIPVTSPFNLQNATFIIGDNEYSEQVSQVEFIPSVDTQPWKGFKHSMTATSRASWTCTIGFEQDLAPLSLMRYMLDHEGESFDCTFIPKEDGPTITANLMLAPASIGGTMNGAYVTGTVTLGVNGKPTFIDPED